jgi:hypothetical protein
MDRFKGLKEEVIQIKPEIKTEAEFNRPEFFNRFTINAIYYTNELKTC